MNYLVAVLNDRMQAEEAYVSLEKEGLPTKQIAILGQGYKSADEYGLVDPNEEAGKQAKFMATWLVPFGFVAGFTFSLITGLDTFAWAGEWGNHIVGGLLGAVSGAMGSVVSGGGAGLIFGTGKVKPFRSRLKAGKYLVVVNGDEFIVAKASRILRRFDPENLQSYRDSSEV